MDAAWEQPSEVSISVTASPESNSSATVSLENPTVEENHDPRTAKHRLREERFQQAKTLAAQGHSNRSIACQLGINVNVVRKY